MFRITASCVLAGLVALAAACAASSGVAPPAAAAPAPAAKAPAPGAGLGKESPHSFSRTLEGTIGDLPVRMRLVRDGDRLTGTYQYESKLALWPTFGGLFLEGTVDANGRFTLTETVGTGEGADKHSGTFAGAMGLAGDALRIEGTWARPDGSRTLPFALAEAGRALAGGRVATADWAEAEAAFTEVVAAKYPRVEGAPGAEAFNRDVRELVARRIAEYKRSVSEDESFAKNRERYRQEIDYAIGLAGPRLASVAFSEYSNFGGAHPATDTFALTYDLERGRPVELAELFGKGSGYEAKLDELARRAVASPSAFPADASPVDERYTAWYLTSRGLVLVYSVPHVLGDVVEVFVPYAELGDLVDPKGPLAGVAGAGRA